MTRTLVFFVFVWMVIGAAVCGADLVSEIDFTAGRSGNVFGDAYEIGDSYASAGANMSLYPSQSTRIQFNAAYTGYKTISDLSNTAFGADAGFLPLSDSLPLSIFLGASAAGRRYGPAYETYNFLAADAFVSLAYKLSSSLRFRAGMTVGRSEYANSPSADSRSYDVYAGFNTTLPGNNTVDIEAGLTGRHYDGMIDVLDGYANGISRDEITGDDLPGYRVGLRYSRPLGNRTGLNLNYEIHRFLRSDLLAVSDLTTFSLSPWKSDWEGELASIGVKSYLAGRVILNTGGAYGDRSYVPLMELFSGNQSESHVVVRDETRITAFLDVTYPISAGGSVLKPTVYFGYTDNDSSDPLYDYSEISLAFGIGLEL